MGGFVCNGNMLGTNLMLDLGVLVNGLYSANQRSVLDICLEKYMCRENCGNDVSHDEKIIRLMLKYGGKFTLTRNARMRHKKICDIIESGEVCSVNEIKLIIADCLGAHHVSDVMEYLGNIVVLYDTVGTKINI